MTRSEAGQVGGVEGAVFGVLIFVMGTLLIANAWGVIDAKLAASAAAREAARTLVESADPAGAGEEVTEVAVRTMTAHGRSADRVDGVTVTGQLVRCGRITVSVRYRVPLIALPLIGRAGSGFTVTGRHSELIDPYRSGLPGEARCA